MKFSDLKVGDLITIPKTKSIGLVWKDSHAIQKGSKQGYVHVISLSGRKDDRRIGLWYETEQVTGGDFFLEKDITDCKLVSRVQFDMFEEII